MAYRTKLFLLTCMTSLQERLKKHKALRSPATRTLLLLTIGVMSCVVVDYFTYPDGAQTEAPLFNQGENGLWFHYLWYFGKKTRTEMREAANCLRDNQILYAYFHVFDVTNEGSLRYRKLAEARDLIRTFHAVAPDTRLIAWISAGDFYPAQGLCRAIQGLTLRFLAAAFDILTGGGDWPVIACRSIKACLYTIILMYVW